MLLAVISLVLLSLPASATAVPRWSDTAIEPPAGMNQTPLYGVACFSLRACTASGQTFTAATWIPGAVAYTFDGTSWRAAEGVTWNPGREHGILRGVSCKAAATTCMTVGSFKEFGGRIAAMAEGQSGTRWTLWNLGIPGGQQAELYGVSCIEANWCMAAGQKMVSGDLKAMAIRYDGRSWTDTAASPESNATLRGVSCTGTSFCMAVGATGALALAQTWDGSRWTALATPPAPREYRDAILNSVSCIESRWCLAAGYYHYRTGTRIALADIWDGRSWTNEVIPIHLAAGNIGAYGVSCLAREECWVAGESFFEARWRPVSSKRTAAATWATYEALISPGAEGAQLRSISCTARDECKAVGWNIFGGTLLALAETLRP